MTLTIEKQRVKIAPAYAAAGFVLLTCGASAQALAQDAGIASLAAVSAASALPDVPTIKAKPKPFKRPKASREGSQRTSEDKSGDEPNAPLGFHMGGFLVTPVLSGLITYNDNIYATENDHKDSVVLEIDPSVSIQADTSRYTLEFSGDVDYQGYLSAKSENRTDWNLGTRFEKDVLRDTYLRLNGAYSQKHEDRGAPDSVATAEHPTAYKEAIGGIELSRELARLKAMVRFDVDRLDFEDNVTGGGDPIFSSDRDRTVATYTADVSYEFSPGHMIFGRYAHINTAYSRSVDSEGYDRDNRGSRITGGARFAVSNLIDGDVYVGHMHYDYDDPRFKTLNRWIYGAGLTWSPTRRTKLFINADRAAVETTATDFAQMLQTGVGVKLQQVIRTGLVFRLGGQYSYMKYLGGSDLSLGQGRTDKQYGVNSTLKYSLNRRWYLTLGFDHTKRTSDQPLSGFNRNKIFGTIDFKF